MSRYIVFVCLSLLAFEAIADAATIGTSTANPNTVPASVATLITFTSVITDPTVIPSTVNLQQLDSSGRATVIGVMRDDGLNGDATANDHTYSFQFTLFQQVTGNLTYRVSAGFLGSLARVLSAPIIVTVTGVSTSITITSPAAGAYLNISPTVVTGTVANASSTVNVNNIAAQVSGTTFSVSVPLREGVNTLTAVALNGSTSATASETVTLDTTPPHVTIDTPANNSITTDSTISVAGIVNDIVVGTVNPLQATVTVNSLSTQVTNRTFVASSIPLQLGANTITATARDRAGNFATTSINVVRQTVTQPTLGIVSGNNLTGSIRTLLAAPLVVQALNGMGQPIANMPVVFQVTGGDGLVSSGSGPGLPSIAVNTNSQGQAQVNFALGSHAGAGNNMVQASAVGIVSTPVFTESATASAPAMIVVDSGNNQSGVVGQPLPLPFIAIVTDLGHNRLGNVPVSFTATSGGGSFSGQNAVIATSDSDGRVEVVLTLGPQAGINNNVVTANFAGNSGLPATFTATSYIPGPVQNTSISGVVLDNSNIPIPGVTMRLYQVNNGGTNNIPQQVVTPVQTNGQGYFSIQPAPVGVFKLMADGTTATRPGPFPTLEYDMITVAGQNNSVGLPVYLPQLNGGSQLCVGPTVGGTLTIPQAPGFALTIAPGSATFPGGTQTGCVSVTPVNMDKVPMVPGFGQQPRFIVTIQPVGTTFNPPAQITIPNVDGLPPRAVTEMYSYDHDLATFVAIGTGTVSVDGSVIASDPGVGVLKAGWHCGGNPNSNGSSGSLAVTLSSRAGPSVAGSIVELTANGTPPLDGVYQMWQTIDDPADPNDDPSVGQFVTTPSCPNQPTCVAQLKGVKFGRVTVRVSFVCTTTGVTVNSNLVKINFTIGLTIKEVNFLSDIDLTRDRVAAFNDLIDPVWKSSNAPADNGEVAYVRNKKIRVSAKFNIDPPLPSPISGITVEAEILGLGKVQATNQTLSGASYDFPATDSDNSLPNTTKYYSSMTFDWKATPDGTTRYVPAGSSANPVYVTLDTPRPFAKQGGKVPVTLLKMALQHDGAADAATALANTWQSFVGPANITTWDGRLMYYYKAGVGFGSCALDYATLITSNPESGQCGSFAQLLLGSLAVNNIQANWVQISTIDGDQMIVKNWTFAAARYAAPDFKWELDVNTPDPMVPDLPGSVYGDLTNVNGLPGQNSPKPSEKIFAFHFIVNASGGYYDPSYGVTYTGAAGFESSALAGYARDFGDGTKVVGGQTLGILRARAPNATLNISFANGFSN